MALQNYAKERRAIHAYKEANAAQVKITEERVADLEQLLDCAKTLRLKGCFIHNALTTDAEPEIWVEPNAAFKQFIVGMGVVIDDRQSSGNIVQVFNHVRIHGVKVKWSEIEIKGPKKGASKNVN